jgi:multiple antibiotic resistance protein
VGPVSTLFRNRLYWVKSFDLAKPRLDLTFGAPAMDINFLFQAIIAMLVITAPPDPAKLVFFNTIIATKGIPRTAAALQVAVTVLIVLGIGALGGAEIAELMGINLDAFSVVGGIVVAGMGFEMLYGGAPSKAQGKDAAQSGPDEDSGLLMPLAIPLIAGPGAIVTAVTITTSNPDHGLVASLIAVAAVAVVTFVGFQWLGGLLAKLPANATALLMRLGGLLLSTIGVQMLLGGLKKFFAS